MWLARGVQSAIFYYATCTPCAAAEDRRRRKKEAIRTQREQAKSAVIVTDQPRPFHQPTPFSTNAGWMEEIALGPGPPARRHRKNCKEDGSTLPRLSSTSSMTVEDSMLSGGREKTSLGEKLHWSHFQREDEVLWGEEEKGNKGKEPAQGSSVGISGRGRAGTSHSNKYYIARAPPVNDLHPPIVSGPTSRADTRWMLQPPPSAKVMAGKARHDTLRDSRQSSVRRRSRIDMKIRESDGEEDETIQEGQLTSITDRPGWLIGKANSYRRTIDNHKKNRPTMLSIDQRSSSPERGRREKNDSDDLENLHLPASTATATAETHRSVSMTNVRAYDEWHLQISPSFHSRSNSPSSMGSPADSLHWPDTPYSRPDSKRTAGEHGKVFHPSYLNLAVSAHREDTNKSIEAIHLEVNEPRSREQMQPLKWRWSFDI